MLGLIKKLFGAKEAAPAPVEVVSAPYKVDVAPAPAVDAVVVVPDAVVPAAVVEQAPAKKPAPKKQQFAKKPAAPKTAAPKPKTATPKAPAKPKAKPAA
jgi:hypothetical protein